ELLGEEEVEGAEAEAEEEEAGAPVAVAAPADWGILPAAVMIPCVLIMFFVGLMSFELLHSMWGYQKPSGVSAGLVKGVAEILGEKAPYQVALRARAGKGQGHGNGRPAQTSSCSR